jgi:deazaflavin-dependent oxidoreductase (nitroreductase family)
MAENDWNSSIIKEFHDNGGKVGGPFEGRTLLLLHSKGARSGQTRINPLAYMVEGDRFIVFASKAGAPTNPDWYYNLIANPEVTIEVGAETLPARATILEGEERDRMWARVVELMPGFGDYEKKTDRTIPAIALERIG